MRDRSISLGLLLVGAVLAAALVLTIVAAATSKGGEADLIVAAVSSTVGIGLTVGAYSSRRAIWLLKTEAVDLIATLERREDEVDYAKLIGKIAEIEKKLVRAGAFDEADVVSTEARAALPTQLRGRWAERRYG